MSKKKYIGICHRCEHRVRFIEEGRSPRAQCSDIGQAVFCCYMYKPVAPVVLRKADGYGDRPQFGPAMISARSEGIRVADMMLELHQEGDESVLYYVPKKKEITADLPDHVAYLCDACARSYGAVWPQEHIATYSIMTCDVCGEERVCANVGDWNWPDGKRRGMRD